MYITKQFVHTFFGVKTFEDRKYFDQTKTNFGLALVALLSFISFAFGASRLRKNQPTNISVKDGQHFKCKNILVAVI